MRTCVGGPLCKCLWPEWVTPRSRPQFPDLQNELRSTLWLQLPPSLATVLGFILPTHNLFASSMVQKTEIS